MSALRNTVKRDTMKYETVYTKHGKAITAGTQTALQSIAKQTGGTVVLLRRCKGEDVYNELFDDGTPYAVDLPFVFGIDFTYYDDMKYNTAARVYDISNLKQYVAAAANETAPLAPDVLNEIKTLEDGDIMFLQFLNGAQSFDTFRKGQTRWFDAEGMEYRLAVITA